MYVSENWLHELFDPKLSTQQLADQLTMAGLEVGSIAPAAPESTGIVVGKVLDCQPHPNAQKLSVCHVDIDADGGLLEIVCGAPNVRAGLFVAVAQVGARLPGKIKIRRAKLRGVESQGMICSARELGLGEEHGGILELPDLPLGADFRQLLALDDQILELELTPNRGDCLGMMGVAREVAALCGQSYTPPIAPTVAATHEETLGICLEAPEQCSLYAGRIVKNINADAKTPLWMVEKLRRAGIRSIHPVVDITNFVMMERGKPMHGFDLATMKGDVSVRLARKDEKLTLLDGRELELSQDILVIADDSGARALAGIMGGVDTGVTENTKDVFFESAYFDPVAIAGKARRFGLHTDASHRFERGVDPMLCVDSIERATQLLIDICGGEPGPVVVAKNQNHLPHAIGIDLSKDHLERLIGRSYQDAQVASVLSNLGLIVESRPDGWRAEVPSHRFDLTIAEDLIEEIVRVVGYDEVEERSAFAELQMAPCPETKISLDKVKNALVSRGYHEAITYSFVDPVWHEVLVPNVEGISLSNPISSDLSVMRGSLLPGLLGAVKNNLNRQKSRVRLFEHGLRFVPHDNDIKQDNMLAVIAAGALYPEQWGVDSEPVGFYDVKNDIEALLSSAEGSLSFESAAHATMHPGQSARIYRNWDHERRAIGWIGALHPKITAQFEISHEVIFCELKFDVAFVAAIPVFSPLSKYPEVRRDLAMIVKEKLTTAEIVAAVKHAAPTYLKDLKVFDIYRGQGIEAGAKSVALGLILQDSSRTLTDEDADSAVDSIATYLKQKLHVKIRD